MPTKVEEEALFVAGKLVVAAKDIYMAGEVPAKSVTSDEPLVVTAGTVGLIMEAALYSEPPGFSGELTLQVQFLNGHIWWVSPREVLPHVGEDNV